MIWEKSSASECEPEQRAHDRLPERKKKSSCLQFKCLRLRCYITRVCPGTGCSCTMGVHMYNRLNRKADTEDVYKKGISRLHFLRNMFNKMKFSYHSLVVSAAHFTGVCWEGSIGAGDTNRRDNPSRMAGSVIGSKLDTFEAVAERRSPNKLAYSSRSPPSAPLPGHAEESYCMRYERVPVAESVC